MKWFNYMYYMDREQNCHLHWIYKKPHLR
jgi:hypothetical protein